MAALRNLALARGKGLNSFARSRLLAGLAVALFLFVSVRAADPLPNRITQARQILELSREVAAKKIPCEIEGVITFIQPELALWFVQDSTAGLYIFPDPSLELRAGESYRLTGFTGKGLHSNFMVAEKAAAAPASSARPMIVSPAEVSGGGFDCQLVQVSEVVRSVTPGANYLHLEVGNINGVARAALPGAVFADPAALINSRVMFTGVTTASFNEKKEFTGYTIRVPSGGQLTILEKGPEPGSEPLLRISEIQTAIPAWKLAHRLRFKGVVLSAWANGTVLIAQTNSTLLIEAVKQPRLAAGMEVEAAGFLGYKDHEICLLWADILSVSTNRSVLPAIKNLTASPRIPRAATLRGKVLSINRNAEKGPRVEILADDLLVNLFAPADSLLLRGEMIGKTISAEGAFRWIRRKEQQIPEFWLAGSSSFHLLKEPLKYNLVPAAWGLAIITITAVFIHFYLRRRGSWVIGTSPEALMFSIEGRERLARDLHDGVIQNLYAIGLSIENCMKLLPKSPGEAQTGLNSVIQQLTTAISQLRLVISGLATEPLKPGEFKAALKSIILTQGELHSSKIILEVDQPASEQLTSAQATQLLHVAREAISNSLRHASPARITIAFHKISSHEVVFEVTDDGKGFEEKTSKKGHGLKNIAARVREVHGTHALHSAPGLGTKLTIHLPIK